MTNRKHTVLALLSISALLLCSGAARAELKIGFVDLAKLSENAPQIISAQGKIDAEFSSREKELVALQRKISKMEEDLATNATVMSDSERSNKERDILSKRRDLKRSQDEFRDDLNIRKNEILKQVNVEIGNVIEKLAKDEHYDLIIAQGVMFASPQVDITDLILKKLESAK
ncbi:MAG: OmpH family outer membrane protein [Pseudomonadota bacterium]